MRKSFSLWAAALMVAAWIQSAHSQVVINELMQSNIDCIMDDLNEFPDSWVELYNSGSAAVNLGEYAVAVDNDINEAWTLPSQTLAPGQFVIVYCDKEGTGMHTTFRIDSGKNSSVYLFHNGEPADKVEKMKKQPAPNIAYGRQTEGSDTWGYQATPTPGAANCGQLCSDILGEPVFSQKGRVTTTNQPFSLTLSLPDDAPEGTEIRYTTNGEEPTATSTKYVAPIPISGNKVVRAKLFCQGYLSPRSTTHSYLNLGHQSTLPIVSVVTNDKYLNDNKIGIYVDGTYQSGKKNYEFDWRRPINFEYFEDANVESALNQLCETRIAGGATRSNMMKTLAVYANKRFGEKRLKYEFFPEQRPGVNDFKSILLRNAGNDFDYLYMRDAIIQSNMAKHVDLDWQAWSPVVIFINGTYKGMLNIRERSNEDNIYTNYDELEDLDMIENWNELKEGDMQSWQEFQAFYNEHGHTLAEYAEKMDWLEFLNLMVMNLYYNNQDFPGNNIVMWRPKAEGGKWRFVAKDTDFGLGLYGSSSNYNTLEWLYNPNYDAGRNWANQYEHTRLFRRLMEDADFKREFIDRTAIYMGDFLNNQGTREVWDPMYDKIKTEYPYHRKLINQWWPNYNDELNSARNWSSQRTNIFYNQMGSYYGLGAAITMKVNNLIDAAELEGVDIIFNGVTLSKGTFDGKFYAGRNVTLEGGACDGRGVTGWTVREVSVNGTMSQREIDTPTYTFTMPTCSTLTINAKIGAVDAITEVKGKAWEWTTVDDAITVSGVEDGQTVRLYDMQGMLVGQQRSNGTAITMPMRQGQVYLLKVGSETVKVSVR